MINQEDAGEKKRKETGIVCLGLFASRRGANSFTVVGAGSRVLGVGLADDVLVYLVPLVLVVTSAERGGEGRRRGREGVRRVAISGSRWRRWGRARGDRTNSMCPRHDSL